ncbi:MAG: putative molybdenum carrier protein [Desulfobacterales bacterium]
MIKKIISGGQTGADRAALDVAINLHIPHGGWVPKNRKAEDGPVPAHYQLKEMSTESYPARTEANVADSDGTLIITHGELKGGSRLTREHALKHGKPHLHIDLDVLRGDDVLYAIVNWIVENHIAVLNVAGSRASEDPALYDTVFEVLNNAVLLLKIRRMRHPSERPQTLDDAVNRLIAELPFKERTKIGNMAKEDLRPLYPEFMTHIRDDFGLWDDNPALLASCRTVAGDPQLHQDEAGPLIVRKLWEKLQKTYRLRLVK